MEMVAASGGGKREGSGVAAGCWGSCFQMPLHYPRYRMEDYDNMPEWQLDRLLSEYGLPVDGNLHHKRAFAIGAFLWGAGAGASNNARHA